MLAPKYLCECEGGNFEDGVKYEITPGSSMPRIIMTGLIKIDYYSACWCEEAVYFYLRLVPFYCPFLRRQSRCSFNEDTRKTPLRGLLFSYSDAGGKIPTGGTNFGQPFAFEKQK